MKLGIILDNNNGAPVNIASVHDPALIAFIAGVAILEARQQAARETDARLRLVRKLESDRLALTLRELIPELKDPGGAIVM